MIRLGKEFTTVAITLLQQSHIYLSPIYQLYTMRLCIYSISCTTCILLYIYPANELVYYIFIIYNLYIHCLPDVLPQRYYIHVIFCKLSTGPSHENVFVLIAIIYYIIIICTCTLVYIRAHGYFCP